MIVENSTQKSQRERPEERGACSGRTMGRRNQPRPSPRPKWPNRSWSRPAPTPSHLQPKTTMKNTQHHYNLVPIILSAPNTTTLFRPSASLYFFLSFSPSFFSNLFLLSILTSPNIYIFTLLFLFFFFFSF